MDASASLDDAFALLSGGAAALVAVRGERPAGVVTKLDLLEYLTHLGERRALTPVALARLDAGRGRAGCGRSDAPARLRPARRAASTRSYPRSALSSAR